TPDGYGSVRGPSDKTRVRNGSRPRMRAPAASVVTGVTARRARWIHGTVSGARLRSYTRTRWVPPSWWSRYAVPPHRSIASSTSGEAASSPGSSVPSSTVSWERAVHRYDSRSGIHTVGSVLTASTPPISIASFRDSAVFVRPASPLPSPLADQAILPRPHLPRASPSDGPHPPVPSPGSHHRSLPVDIAELKSKSVAALHELAEELNISKYKGLRKNELIEVVELAMRARTPEEPRGERVLESLPE